jgi:hypothetical protein
MSRPTADAKAGTFGRDTADTLGESLHASYQE